MKNILSLFALLFLINSYNQVDVFKKKRRKGYKVKNGHRQQMTEIIIEKVNEKSAAKAKAATKPKEEKPKAKATKTNSKTKK